MEGFLRVDTIGLILENSFVRAENSDSASARVS